VQAAFDKAVSERNTSSIVADLMRRAVCESVQRSKREHQFQPLCADRFRRPAASSLSVRKARNTDFGSILER